MSRDAFSDRVDEWIADGAVCSDCGHLHANHDCGWCYTCAKTERQCGSLPAPPRAPQEGTK